MKSIDEIGGGAVSHVYRKVEEPQDVCQISAEIIKLCREGKISERNKANIMYLSHVCHGGQLAVLHPLYSRCGTWGNCISANMVWECPLTSSASSSVCWVFHSQSENPCIKEVTANVEIQGIHLNGRWTVLQAIVQDGEHAGAELRRMKGTDAVRLVHEGKNIGWGIDILGVEMEVPVKPAPPYSLRESTPINLVSLSQNAREKIKHTNISKEKLLLFPQSFPVAKVRKMPDLP